MLGPRAPASGRCFLDSVCARACADLEQQYKQTAVGAVEKDKTSTTNKTPPGKQSTKNKN